MNQSRPHLLILAVIVAPLFVCGAARAQIIQTPDADFLELVKNGKTEDVARTLIRGQSANTADSNGRTAMMYAAAGGYVEIIEILVKNKANVRIKDKQGRSALYWAAAMGHEDALELLLKLGAPANDPDRQGTTPLMVASRRGFEGVVRQLLAAKADVNATDHTGRTALMWSQEGRNPHVPKLLKEAGAR
ncbi:MAG: ankyrin repeat domain-containing protein [Rhodospirillales bacterium]